MAVTPTTAAADLGPVTRPAPSRTLQAYGRTLLWTFGAIAACGVCYVVEKYVVLRGFDLRGVGLPIVWAPLAPLVDDAPYRMFKNPAELPMRLFGLPHFIVGLLFMLTSTRMRGARSYAWLVGLTLAGVGGCLLFARYGGSANPYMLLLFYFYFLIHGFRDEAFFYRAYGELPREQAQTHQRILVVLQLLLLGVLVSLLLPAYMLYGAMNPDRPEYQAPALERLFPSDWPYASRFLVLVIPMGLIAAAALAWIARQFPDGLRGMWHVHRPILTVFLGSTALILLALVSGPWTFNAVVLMHFVAWYLFGRWSLAAHPPKHPPQSTWQWMRTTPQGFTVLHLGLAALVVVLVAISTYAMGRQGLLEQIVGSKVFFYWTILHVTLSFFPRN